MKCQRVARIFGIGKRRRKELVRRSLLHVQKKRSHVHPRTHRRIGVLRLASAAALLRSPFRYRFQPPYWRLRLLQRRSWRSWPQIRLWRQQVQQGDKQRGSSIQHKFTQVTTWRSSQVVIILRLSKISYTTTTLWDRVMVELIGASLWQYSDSDLHLIMIRLDSLDLILSYSNNGVLCRASVNLGLTFRLLHHHYNEHIQHHAEGRGRILHASCRR